jgi:hypothetical protein
MTAVWIWLDGKKTYIAAGALAILGAVLILNGDTGTGMESILVGAALAGLGDRANRHQAEILAAVQDIGKLATDAKSGSAGITADDAIKVIGDALQLKAAAAQDRRPTGGTN